MQDNRPRSPGATRFAERHAARKPDGAVPPWVHEQGPYSAIVNKKEIVASPRPVAKDKNGELPLGMLVRP